MKNIDTKYEYSIKVLFLLVISFVSLFIWFNSPFYPDELAFRVSRLSFISNDNKIYNLFRLCNSNSLNLPLIFKPAAYFLSLIGISMSSIQIRLLPIITALLLLISVAYYIKEQKNKDAIFLMSLAFIGISSSGLVITRFEFITLMCISICIFSIAYSKVKNSSSGINISLLLCVLFTTTVSCFIHPQGLLFVPLSAYSVYRLSQKIIKNKYLNKIFDLSNLLGSIYLIFVGSSFNSTGCKDSKDMDEVFTSMVLQFNDLYKGDFLLNKFNAHLNNFLYKDEYLANYLPGVGNTSTTAIANLVIQILIAVLIIISFLCIIIFLFKLGLSIKSAIFKSAHFKRNEYFNQYYQWILLLIIPALFLFIYDKNQYFYRSFFINFVLCISISILLSHLKKSKFKILNLSLSVICVLSLVFSIFLNYKHFYHILPHWNAIYSVPVKSAMQNQSINIHSLLKKCSIDINKGSFLIDDYTYDTLKKNPQLQIIYYASFQADTTKNSKADTMKLLKINGVIASCDSMKRSGMGWPPQFVESNLCCFNPN